MAKYYISITETINRVVCIEAKTLDDAICIAEQAYCDEEIVLDASDYVDTVIEDATKETYMRIGDGEISEERFQIVSAAK